MMWYLSVFFVTMSASELLGQPTSYAGINPPCQNRAEDNEIQAYDFPFVTRGEWQARSAKEKNQLSTPTPYVVIHHSYTPQACYNVKDCSNAMRSMQDFHMDGHGWWDVGYSFAVGSDGVVYEGRGWKTLGAHALHFNTVSIGICLIGDWTSTLPPSKQIKAAKSLIAAGVELGYIKPDYKLLGHRQVRATDCPGEVLYEDVKTWSHYSSFPSNYKDLVYVKELPDSIREHLLMNNTTV